MEDLFDFLTKSAFEEINEHNQTANTKHVPKAHSAHGKLRDICSRNLRERLICGKRPCLEYDEPQIKKKRRISYVSVCSSNNIHSQLNIKNTTNKSPSNGTQPDHKQIPHKEPVIILPSKGANNNTAKRSQHQEPTRQKIHKVSSDISRKKISVNKTASEVAVTDIYKNKQRQESVPEIDYKTQKKSLEPVIIPVLQTTTTEHRVIEKKLIPSYDFSLYPTVQGIEQRCEYKCDFERIYEEYSRLRQRVEEVRYIFRLLPEQLKNVPEGSAEYQRIANRIFAEYVRLNSKEEIELKRRFDYLEAKLIHIKQRVDDFDQKLTKESAAQAALAAYSQR